MTEVDETPEAEASPDASKWGNVRYVAMDLLIGTNVFVRTVTYHYTGVVRHVDSEFLYLDDAAWVADSGRFSHALATGTLNEVEPYPTGLVLIGKGAIVDISIWNHPLPRTIK